MMCHGGAYIPLTTTLTRPCWYWFGTAWSSLKLIEPTLGTELECVHQAILVGQLQKPHCRLVLVL